MRVWAGVRARVRVRVGVRARARARARVRVRFRVRARARARARFRVGVRARARARVRVLLGAPALELLHVRPGLELHRRGRGQHALELTQVLRRAAARGEHLVRVRVRIG